MQHKKQNSKASCSHKPHKLSLDSKLKPLRKQSLSSKPPAKLAQSTRQLLLQNQQLREENFFYQEYFATFEQKYKQQKKENKQLKKQIQELSRERDTYSMNKRCSTVVVSSEKTITNKLSRATKCSR